MNLAIEILKKILGIYLDFEQPMMYTMGVVVEDGKHFWKRRLENGDVRERESGFGSV